VQPELLGISSPLTRHLHQWRRTLAGHPDREFATYVLNGIERGFRVGFVQGSPLSPASRNMHSAALHPSVVDSYISTETREGRMLGPFPPGRIEGLQINRMGVVPKGHTPGRWRLITDLSYPEGNSVSDGIQSELCSLKWSGSQGPLGNWGREHCWPSWTSSPLSSCSGPPSGP
jgi:hypothetical protein